MNYKEVEKRYQELAALRKTGRLSQNEWEQQLKALLLQDAKGRYWTIGAQTGKWYYYDGTKWAEGTPQNSVFNDAIGAPPSAPLPTGVICPYCGFENQGMHSLCSRCGRDLRAKDIKAAATPRETATCPFCGVRVEPHSQQCPSCSRNLSDRSTSALSARPAVEELVLTKGGQPEFIEASTGSGHYGDERELRAVNLASCFRFLGGAALIIGLVIGVFLGAVREFGLSAFQTLPLITELKGRWLGGLAFGLVGAASGGLVMGIYGVLLGFLYNLLAIIFGGLRFKVHRSK